MQVAFEILELLSTALGCLGSHSAQGCLGERKKTSRVENGKALTNWSQTTPVSTTASGERRALPGTKELCGAGRTSPHHQHYPYKVSPPPMVPHFWSSLCVSSKLQSWRHHQTIPSLPSPPTANHNLAADNEDRTTIQKTAWLWRLRTCPNCTCRFSFPGADGHWLRCTCRRPAPCLSVTYFVLRVQALACSTSCSACDDIFSTSLTSQQALQSEAFALLTAI